ncbi:MAG TPA: S-adenosylmethionine:tRNA ribosyltransferase-isomerase, partial [Verrucomicrobiae bacterium]|nr:S-adenosylmethionine:tRNA ribosyltransferase-isomerase [Verrucomicrobiae bacterium]
MQTEDFNYELPPELIAQRPAERRDASRLLVLHRESARREHCSFPDLLGYLRAGDLLVLNNSRVIPARLRGFKPGTHGQVEVLLLEEVARNDWWVMLKPGKRVRRGTVLQFRDKAGNETAILAEVLEKNEEGQYRLGFSGSNNIQAELASIGEVPLPPYIERLGGLEPEDAERYQTVFARENGSVAAPTAGLHFDAA